ncbi:2-oxo acid dehydrogenase subunit E2 [Phreatobacter oligotrophus]|uniref:2-oxoacid dehydrogenase/acyltransferase catalytic subunit n=1 Tax=Phreatobacter oligotrophus TaxID=1122261 RepID=A0A2T4YWF2_9HYPH|nr:2-oxo acid dehydrogenase subunit E2 [Phreatobacter oligotrophus]PTM48451.1 hypothetical protein C8P69_12514 [Phreatobacter oligotrophus]
MPNSRIELSPGRRFMADLSWLALKVPTSVLKRTIDLGPLSEARAASAESVPWPLIVAKAYGLTSRDHAFLRRSYVPWPHAHLSEAPYSIATVMVWRVWGGDSAALFARIIEPEAKPLVGLAAELRAAVETPIEEFHSFRALRILDRLPRFVRRIAWWYAFNSGFQRPRFFGTFGVTILGQRGLTHLVPLAPVTSAITVGPIGASGAADVTVAFDHRVMDGVHVADALDAFENHLNGPILAELRALAS